MGGHGDFFGFEHDAKANGLNVLLIWGFQDMPRALELMEPYLIYLTSIGSLITTKIVKHVYCMAKIN
jgi:hypothetical protein